MWRVVQGAAAEHLDLAGRDRLEGVIVLVCQARVVGQLTMAGVGGKDTANAVCAVGVAVRNL